MIKIDGLMLDYIIERLKPGELSVIASRPGMGKTTVAANIALRCALHEQITTAFFSLELSKAQLVEKMDCSGEAQIIIDDTPGITVSEIHQQCRELKNCRGLGLVLIDYFQLLIGGGNKTGKTETRKAEVNEMTALLKDMSRDLCIPVIVTSQLSRSCEERPDHRPRISDFGDADVLADAADNVILLYRDDYYHPDSEKAGECELILAKVKQE